MFWALMVILFAAVRLTLILREIKFGGAAPMARYQNYTSGKYELALPAAVCAVGTALVVACRLGSKPNLNNS